MPRPIKNKAVAQAFRAFPPGIRPRLMALRELIFKTAAATDGVGEIEETLRWGEPAYLTSQSGSGSTIRLGWKAANPSQYAMYFICHTNLVATFRALFPGAFKFDGDRAILFDEHDAVPTGPLAFCVAATLTYHRDKQARTRE